MEIHATEEQQVEALKKWWKENGSSVITGLLLGLAVLFGAKSWFAYQDRQAENASNIYATLMTALNSGEEAKVNEMATMLIAEYGSTPYASIAALALAKIKLEQGELEAAQAQLQWALENTGSDTLQHTARLRLARVMLAQDNADGAEKLLAAVRPEGAFAALYSEVMGDIHAAQGDISQARADYQQALATMTTESTGRQLLQLKYDNTNISAPSESAQ